MSNRKLELKVGAFLLVSILVLVGFVIVLGNWGFSSGNLFYVDFPNSSGLREGAKVKVSGVRAGTINEIRFLGGQVLDDQGNPVYVRIQIEIRENMLESMTEGARFTISSEGLLGERYIEVTPGSPGSKPLANGAVVRGAPPVEFQELSSKAADMVDRIQEMVEGERGDLKKMGNNLKKSVERLEAISRTLEEELPGIVERANALMEKGTDTLERFDALVEDGRTLISREKGVKEAVANISDLAARFEAEVPHLLDEADLLFQDADDFMITATRMVKNVDEELSMTALEARVLLDKTGRVVEQLELKDTIAEFRASISRLVDSFGKTGDVIAGLASKASTMVEQLTEVVKTVKTGEGTLGAILQDREVYDDVRELILDLKRNPWKIIWKP
jgi:phospholipid/cholesterol/gamma-HCH transport system substrate-binding protein